MIETLNLAQALLAGVLLGAVFFGGLWWTIRRVLHSGRPAAWFLGSLLLRATIAVGGFYLVSNGDWRRLVACLSGFIVSRIFVTLLTRAPIEKGKPLIEGRRP
jgi:F1F0 ATPase subunit 2